MKELNFNANGDNEAAFNLALRNFNLTNPKKISDSIISMSDTLPITVNVKARKSEHSIDFWLIINELGKTASFLWIIYSFFEKIHNKLTSSNNNQLSNIKAALDQFDKSTKRFLRAVLESMTKIKNVNRYIEIYYRNELLRFDLEKITEILPYLELLLRGLEPVPIPVAYLRSYTYNTKKYLLETLIPQILKVNNLQIADNYIKNVHKSSIYELSEKELETLLRLIDEASK